RANIDPDRIFWIGGHPFAEDAHERVRGEPLRLPAPGLARIRGLPDGHLSLREDAVLPTDQRGDEGGMLLVRMGCDGESEVGGQPFRDLRPSPAIRSAMVGPAVILLEDRSVPRAVPREFVDALAPFGVLVRHELRAHAAVFGRPSPAPVLRLEGADGTDSREQVARLARIDEDRMQA